MVDVTLSGAAIDAATSTASIAGGIQASELMTSDSKLPADRIHEVKKNEYLEQIAKQHGVPADLIWNDPANAELKDLRQTPNILYQGDKLKIPELRTKSEVGDTETRNRFNTKRKMQRIRLVLRDTFDQPMGDVPYTLTISEGISPITGKTQAPSGPGGEGGAGGASEVGDSVANVGDTDEAAPISSGVPGAIEAEVPAGTSTVKLSFLGRDVVLVLGGLDPASEISGVQQRLKGLGFDCGGADGKYGPKTKAALMRFQIWMKLNQQDGKVDQETCEKLEKEYCGVTRAVILENSEAPSNSNVTRSGSAQSNAVNSEASQ